MNSNLYKKQFIMFIIMVIIGMLFNPMNILAYRFSDLHISHTLFYGGVLMASIKEGVFFRSEINSFSLSSISCCVTGRR